MNAQQWLTNEYSNKQTIWISLNENIRLEGNLIIEDFPKLEGIIISNRNKTSDAPKRLSVLPNVQIRNCPQLKHVEIVFCEVQNLSISNCPEVKSLNLEFNSLTSLNVNELTNLVSLNCLGNSLTALDISHNLKLKVLECDDNLNPIQTLTQKIQAKFQGKLELVKKKLGEWNVLLTK